MEEKTLWIKRTDKTRRLEWSYYHTVWHFHFGDDFPCDVIQLSGRTRVDL